MNDEIYILELIRQNFATVQSEIKTSRDALEVLQDKTERSGESDGFRQYLFADLPYAADGMTEVRFAFVTNGRDVGEGAGNGTGVLCVYKPNLDEWRVVATNVAVTV